MQAVSWRAINREKKIPCQNLPENRYNEEEPVWIDPANTSAMKGAAMERDDGFDMNALLPKDFAETCRRLPTMVALPLRDLLGRKDPESQAWDVLFAVENACKLLFYVAWIHLKRAGASIPAAIQASAATNINMFTLGNVQWLLGHVSAVPETPPELRTATQALSNLKSTEIKKIRNDLAHCGAGRKVVEKFLTDFFHSEDDGKSIFAQFSDALFALDLSLLSRTADGRTLLLAGAKPVPVDDAGPMQTAFHGQPGQEEVIALTRDGSVPLWPMLRLLASADTEEETGWYHRFEQKKIEYRLSEDCAYSPDGVGHFLDLFHHPLSHLWSLDRMWQRTYAAFDSWKRASVGNCREREEELGAIGDALAGKLDEKHHKHKVFMVSARPKTGASTILGKLADEEEKKSWEDDNYIVISFSFDREELNGYAGTFWYYCRAVLQKYLEARGQDARFRNNAGDPWDELADAFGKIENKTRLLLIVDAVDVAEESDPEFMRKLVEAVGKIKRNIKAICSRHVREYGNRHLETFQDKIMPICFDGACVLPRISPEKLHAIAVDWVPDLAQKLASTGSSLSYFKALLERSNGSMSYFKAIVEQLKSRTITPGDPTQLPESEDAMVRRWFNKYHLHETGSLYSRVLRWLTVCRSPLSLTELLRFIRLKKLNESDEVVHQALNDALTELTALSLDDNHTPFYSMRDKMVGENFAKINANDVAECQDIIVKLAKDWRHIAGCLKDAVAGGGDAGKDAVGRMLLAEYGLFPESPGPEDDFVLACRAFLFDWYPRYLYTFQIDHLREYYGALDRSSETGRRNAVAALNLIDDILCDFTFAMERFRTANGTEEFSRMYSEALWLRRETERETEAVEGHDWKIRWWLPFLSAHRNLLLLADEQWPVNRIVLQLAVESGPDHPAAAEAERWLELDRCDWGWVRKTVVAAKPELWRKHPQTHEPYARAHRFGNRTGVLYLDQTLNERSIIPMPGTYDLYFLDATTGESTSLWREDKEIFYTTVDEDIVVATFPANDEPLSIHCLNPNKRDDEEGYVVWERRALVDAPNVFFGENACIAFVQKGNVVSTMLKTEDGWKPGLKRRTAYETQQVIALGNGDCACLDGNTVHVLRSQDESLDTSFVLGDDDYVPNKDADMRWDLHRHGDKLLARRDGAVKVFSLDGVCLFATDAPIPGEKGPDVRLLAGGRYLYVREENGIGGYAVRIAFLDEMPENRVIFTTEDLTNDPDDMSGDGGVDVMGEKVWDDRYGLYLGFGDRAALVDFVAGKTFFFKNPNPNTPLTEACVLRDLNIVALLFEKDLWFCRMEENGELRLQRVRMNARDRSLLLEKNHRQLFYVDGNLYFTDGAGVWRFNEQELTGSPRPEPTFIGYGLTTITDVFEVDDERICLCEGNGDLAVFSLRKQVRPENMHVDFSLTACSFDPESRRLLTVDNRTAFSVWDLSHPRDALSPIQQFSFPLTYYRKVESRVKENAKSKSASATLSAQNSRIISYPDGRKYFLSIMGAQIATYDLDSPAEITQRANIDALLKETARVDASGESPLFQGIAHIGNNGWPFTVVDTGGGTLAIFFSQPDKTVHCLGIDLHALSYNLVDLPGLPATSGICDPSRRYIACPIFEGTLLVSLDPRRRHRLLVTAKQMVQAVWNDDGSEVVLIDQTGASGTFVLPNEDGGEFSADPIEHAVSLFPSEEKRKSPLQGVWKMPGCDLLVYRTYQSDFSLFTMLPDGKTRKIRDIAKLDSSMSFWPQGKTRTLENNIVLFTSEQSQLEDKLYCLVNTRSADVMPIVANRFSVAEFVELDNDGILDVSPEGVRVCRGGEWQENDETFAGKKRQHSVRWLENVKWQLHQPEVFQFTPPDQSTTVVRSSSRGLETLQFMWGKDQVSRAELGRRLCGYEPPAAAANENAAGEKSWFGRMASWFK